MPLVVRRATASEIAGRPAQRNVEAATETSLPLANRAEGPRPAESTQPPGTAMEAGRPLVQRATACEAVGQPAQQVVDPVAPTPPPLASHREGSRPAGTAQPPGIAMEARLPIMQRATASEIAGQLVRRSTYEPGPSPLGFAQESTTPRARRIAPGSEGGVAEARVTERAASPPALALAFRRANQPPAWQAKSTASRPVFANAPTISGLRISSAPDVLVFRQADASAGLHPPATAMSAGQPAARSRPAGAAGGAVPAPEEEPARPSTPETLDLERLADEVTAIIERRLVFERETRGL